MTRKTIMVTGESGYIAGNFVHDILDKYAYYRSVCVNALVYAYNLEKRAAVMENLMFRHSKTDVTNRKVIEILFQ